MEFVGGRLDVEGGRLDVEGGKVVRELVFCSLLGMKHRIEGVCVNRILDRAVTCF
jgi:hypothetical protein